MYTSETVAKNTFPELEHDKIKEHIFRCALLFYVPREGIEPSWTRARTILSRVRLPIPPPRPKAAKACFVAKDSIINNLLLVKELLTFYSYCAKNSSHGNELF